MFNESMEVVQRDSDSKPLISVIVPVYNGEKYIEETVCSVLKQDYDNIELIVIIDGTKDRTSDILNPYVEQGRLKVLEQENMGASATRNKGMKLAKGDYVLMLDQDDLIEPTLLSKALQLAQAAKSSGVVVNGQLIDSHGAVIRRMYRFRKPTLKLKDMLCKNQIYTTSQVLFNRQKILLLGGLDAKNAGIADDWDLMLRLVLSGGKLDFLDEMLMSYRIHDSNASRNLDRMLTCELNVLDGKQGRVSDGQIHKMKSYRYLYHAFRLAGAKSELALTKKSLGNALVHNRSLLLQPRFYAFACYIFYQGMRSSKTLKQG